MQCIVYPQKLNKLEKDLGKTLECSHISPNVLKNRKLFILGTPNVGHDRRESHFNPAPPAGDHCSQHGQGLCTQLLQITHSLKFMDM